MADNQRIHPVAPALEAPPPPPTTQPPVPSSSEKCGPIHPVAHALEAPPPPPPTQPPVPSSSEKRGPIGRTVAPPLNPPKRSNCWCRCLCWTVGVLVLLIIIIVATAGIIYLVFRPKLPNYSVDNLTISDMTLNFDLSLSVTFNIRITANNPNKKIGIYYEKGSRLSAWYKNTNLCQGTIPRFYQGHQNRTVLHVDLTGQNQYGRTLLEALQEQQQTGSIPLNLRIGVPVSIKLGMLKLKKVRILGNCRLIVDSLSTNTLINIKTNTCKFRLKP